MNYNTNCKNKKPLIILMTFLYLINYFIFNLFTSKYPKTEVTITNIKDSVFNYGLLTPFWEDRLSRFEELGVI